MAQLNPSRHVTIVGARMCSRENQVLDPKAKSPKIGQSKIDTNPKYEVVSYTDDLPIINKIPLSYLIVIKTIA